jgi:glycyl-tRNA synthetase
VDDETVTIRYRDTMLQDRVPVSQLRAIIADKVSLREQLKKL